MRFAREASFGQQVQKEPSSDADSSHSLQHSIHPSSNFSHSPNQLASMSGRGKGGKGLGKGGAKRHRKVLRDNIQGAACAPFVMLVPCYSRLVMVPRALPAVNLTCCCTHLAVSLPALL